MKLSYLLESNLIREPDKHDLYRDKAYTLYRFLRGEVEARVARIAVEAYVRSLRHEGEKIPDIEIILLKDRGLNIDK
jgi:hypothetical protein